VKSNKNTEENLDDTEPVKAVKDLKKEDDVFEEENGMLQF
jgi:hypothetical protein